MSESRKRGRPAGAGKKDDSTTLRDVAKLMVAEPGLKATAAMKRVHPKWTESLLRRLQYRWKENGKSLLAEAKADLERLDHTTDRDACGSLASGYATASGAVYAASLGGLSATHNDVIQNAARGFANNSAIRAAEAISNSAAMRAARAISNNSATQVMADIYNSPAMRLMRELENSPAMRMARDLERLEQRYSVLGRAVRGLGY